MAGRTSTSVGMGVTVTILSLLTLTLFVLSVVYFGRYKDQVRQNEQLKADSQDIIRPDERGQDFIRNLTEDARKDRKSLVGYLVETQGTILERVTGSRRDRLADLATKIGGIQGADNASLISVIANRDNQIANLTAQVQQADAARAAAIADLKAEVDRVDALQRSHQATVDAINGQVGQYYDEIQRTKAEVERYKGQVDDRLDRARADASATEKRLSEQVRELSNQNLILNAQLAELRGQRQAAMFRGKDEAALVDGTIIGMGDTGKRVFLSLGSDHKIQLGMTFTVYNDAASIRPDENGNYAPGKGTVEVISLTPTSATARITSEARGNPIVKGDVIANALYDPNKIYRFVVFGNFDMNGDGVATPLERQDIEATIREWGGQVVADLTGDVDFLILGERPILPPRPGADAPIEVVTRFVQISRDAERYDALFRQAAATSVPILNENRLYTMTGRTPAGRR